MHLTLKWDFLCPQILDNNRSWTDTVLDPMRLCGGFGHFCSVLSIIAEICFQWGMNPSPYQSWAWGQVKVLRREAEDSALVSSASRGRGHRFCKVLIMRPEDIWKSSWGPFEDIWGQIFKIALRFGGFTLIPLSDWQVQITKSSRGLIQKRNENSMYSPNKVFPTRLHEYQLLIPC